MINFKYISSIKQINTGQIIDETINEFMKLYSIADHDKEIINKFENIASYFIEIINSFKEGKDFSQYFRLLSEAFNNLTDELYNYYKIRVIIYGSNNLAEYLRELLNKQLFDIILVKEKVNFQICKDIDYIINCTEDFELDFDSNKIINMHKLLKEYYLAYQKVYYSNYDYNFIKSSLKKAKADSTFEIFISGLSYAARNLNEQIFAKKTIKLATDSQDIYYNYLLAKNLLDKVSGIKYCILGLGYYSFGCDMSKSNDGRPRIENLLYPILNDLHGHKLSDDYKPPIGVDRIEKIVSLNNPIITVEILNQCLQNIWNIDLLMMYKKPDMVLFGSKSLEEQSDYGYKRAKSHNRLTNEQTIMENKQVFEQYLTLLKEKNISLIIVVFPALDCYRKHFDENIRNNFYKIINEFHVKYNFQFFDFFYSHSFEVNDFSDSDHLNALGAEKMTNLLNELISW